MSTQNNEPENIPFQAEVSNVMDIVINSLYTDKEIFVRELISNSVDALEKMRHLTLTEKNIFEKELPLEISIELDDKENTLTIIDTGIGMIRDELIENLGRIAHSGSRDFFEKLAENLKKDINLIGQFGIGFYSAFMVAQKVTVLTKSYVPVSSGYEWSSDGSQGFTITKRDGLSRGTTIVLDLKDDAKDFAQESTIKRIIKKYSNFVPFPIKVKSEEVNTIQALWTRNKNEIKESEYTEFYKFVAGAYDEPMDKLHFSTDAPLALNALLFIPKDNMESMGFGKLEPSVDLHCRKVLIQKHATGLLPPWLRFLKGVIDSEDLPLNISRESMQDSALIRRINKAITNRFVKFLESKAKQDEESYLTFWRVFGTFLKEGVISDHDQRKIIAPLLRYESSKSEPGTSISLDQYVERMPEDQTSIYFINGFDRDSLLKSPYLEVFKERDIEVIYTFDPADDFVMSHLDTFKDKKLVSADTERLDLPDSKKEKDKESKEQESELSTKEAESLKDWIAKVLKDKITEVRISKRLVESPVILVNPDSQVTGAMQRMLQAMNKDYSAMNKLALEFNPNHPLLSQLNTLRTKDSLFAELSMEQLFDQAAMTAGFTVEPNPLIERMNKIIARALTSVPESDVEK